MDGKTDRASGGGMWALAFDKETGKHAGFACCPEGQIVVRETLFEMDGYRARC